MSVKGKTVLITGGTGSIGKVLVSQCLHSEAEKVIVISRDETKHFLLQRELGNKRLRAFVADVRDPNALNRVLGTIAPVDVLFHAAAMKHVIVSEDNPTEATLTNALGTQNIIDIAVKHRIPTSVLISTDKAVEPINVMGATKLIAERIFLNAAKTSKQQKFVITRFGNVANSRASVIPTLVDALLSKRELIVTNPNVDRFIMKIEDAVKLVLEASKLALGGEIFVLKMQAFKLQDLVDVITERIAPRLDIDTKNIRIKQIGLVHGEKMHEKLFSHHEVDEVYDLGDLYVIADTQAFPKHKKYLNCPHVRKPDISSEDAPRISQTALENIIMEYIETRRELLQHRGNLKIANLLRNPHEQGS